MSHNKTNLYNIDTHIAELYDQQEDYHDDVYLLLDLIGQRAALNIFEPFCGTGRILIPLAQAGHHLTGLDQSAVLLQSCREKLRRCGAAAKLIEDDAVESAWPGEMDLVILGCNCLYELATPQEQQSCIRAAASALAPGGHLFLDTDHMEGQLPPSWTDTSVHAGFPSGLCADGVRLESTLQTIWSDPAARLARFQRQIKAFLPDGQVLETTYIQQKHPVSAEEVKDWLKQSGFIIEQWYGSRQKETYTPGAPRAIFWAKKP